MAPGRAPPPPQLPLRAVAVLAACALAAAAASALLLLLLLPSPSEAHASQPCSAHDAEKVWRAYDSIYTGSVAFTEQLRGDGGDDGVRVHFKAARTLKGSTPPDRWHSDMPERVGCYAGGACSETARLYLPGTEIFYLDGFNGLYSPVSGACGVESALAGTGTGVPGDVFSYYAGLYGFLPPLDNPCASPDHVLVVRGDGGKSRAACVRPSTSERLGWEPFDRERWGRSHAAPAPEYDLPIEAFSPLGRGGDGRAFSLSLSRLPAVNETAVVTALYDGAGLGGPLPGATYTATVMLSPNLEFVGLDGVEVRRPLYRSSGSGSGSGSGEAQAYSFDIGPGPGGGSHSFAATVRAAAEGYAHVSYFGEYHSALVEMHAGDRAGLLVDDYHRMESPLPDMSGFRGGGWASAAWSQAGTAPLRIAK